eukprot:CAMPEP_0175471752 /NCGR_PEP_ID=MMETSP0095-20121207/73520_1 /TAXON_ID=311494 /ORGANISM="Alexandrium monilatum, Strain CCMP3105" /LENGTH=56 /DNA_ID=CAMNT_0016773211 /DNA_START=12 /DNA_END=179 /DNA_ORIENTATION=-
MTCEEDASDDDLEQLPERHGSGCGGQEHERRASVDHETRSASSTTSNSPSRRAVSF